MKTGPPATAWATNPRTRSLATAERTIPWRPKHLRWRKLPAEQKTEVRKAVRSRWMRPGEAVKQRDGSEKTGGGR